MASIYKRKNPNGTSVWGAVVRIKGHRSICSHCNRKQEAEDWAQEVERQIKTGQFKFELHNKIHTFRDLVSRYKQDGALQHHRSADDTLRHLDYWQSGFSDFTLAHLTTELLGKELLSEDEITRLLGAAKESKSPYLYCIILLALTTAARQGEILNLKWRHIDFQNKIAYIKETKNGRPRSIALCNPVIEELKKLMDVKVTKQFSNQISKKILKGDVL